MQGPPRTAPGLTSPGWVLPALTTFVAVAACETPPLDDLRSSGGTAFDPSGVIAGSIQYAGPRVPCAPGPDDGELAIFGRVVLTLFRADDPPPPRGTATSALNLLLVPGDRLFRAPEDCIDPTAPPEVLGEVILRSVPFEWPEIPLGTDGAPVAYEVRSFYDADGDFVPFFGELNQPTGGDHVGGALAPDMRFSPVVLGAADDHPRGDRVDGVAVNLAAVNWTERPVFTVAPASGNLSSETTFPATPDPLAVEQGLFEAAGLVLNLVDPEDAGFLEAAASLGVSFGAGTAAHAWFLRDVDLDGDGAQDPHPVLQGVGWTTPLLSFTRIRTPAEVMARVPPVTLVGSVRPSLPAQGKRVVYPGLDVLVAPVALVDLVPGRPECRVPYVPPGNFREAYEGVPRACQELPTGLYAVTALQGVLGGGPFAPAPLEVSDTGFDLSGEALATQSWTVPNAVDAAVAAAPLPDTVLVVFDPDPADGVGDESEACRRAPSPVSMDVQDIAFVDPPADCCTPAIAALCDVPLCGTGDLTSRGRSDLSVRQAGDGSGTPAICTPLRPPPACCR